MSSSRSPFGGAMRTAVERIRHQLPAISPSVSSPSGREETADGPLDDDRHPEVLTNRERVIQVLELNGGRAWQADIVDRTEWSKAKVSRVLSKMEADGSITRFRNGREKVVCLAEAEPRSPTDQPNAPAVN